MVDFHGRIEIVDSPQKVRKALAELAAESVVGFDTETRPNFRKGQNNQVALIQMATATRSYLFRICRTGLMPEIIEFMENPSVTKVGLSLKDDFHNLHKLAEFTPASFVELQSMVHEYSITDASLQKIYAILFGRRISKGQRLSNWEASELTPAQSQYASIDSWACLMIYNYLRSGQFVPEASPYIVHPSETVSES